MTTRHPILIALAALVCGGCASAPSSLSSDVRDRLPVRAASDVPPRFEPRSASLRVAPRDTIAGSGCLSPMVDPRDGTEIRFIFSTWYGDYELPAGRYGAAAGDVLRLECNTGRVIGLVPR